MFQGDKIWMGVGDVPVNLLLNQANRHGLIAGASGTGKTVTLKVMAEGFSKAGVPVFMADVKGDVTGMAQAGEDSDNIKKRVEKFGLEGFTLEGCPCRFWDMLGGQGYVNILNAAKLIQSPQIYAMFLLWMLSELFDTLPEAGDLDKPKFGFFFDEAHLLFNNMPDELLDKIVQVVKLIRSKGVGVYFITQSPSSIPDEVLAQLSCPLSVADCHAASRSLSALPRIPVAELARKEYKYAVRFLSYRSGRRLGFAGDESWR